jgi:TPR repeat protein
MTDGGTTGGLRGRKSGGTVMIHSAWRWRGKAAPSLMLGLLMAAGQAFWAPAAQAQGRSEALVLMVSPAIALAPSSQVPLSIELAPAAAVPPRAIVLIKGLPATISLSEGRLFESGVWAVAAAHAGPLTITASSVAAGRSDLTISLVAIDGTLLAEAKSALLISAAEPQATAAVTVTVPANTIFTAALPQRKPRDIIPPVTKRLTSDQTELLLGLVKKGDELMTGGNVAAARLLYRHAADNGLAAAALALATTFDGQELSRRRVLRGVRADPKQAQFWYEKARELGSADARERLLRLGSR